MPFALVMPTVARVTPRDLRQAAVLLADGLRYQPLARWLVPDDAHREDILDAHARIITEHALTYGHVDMLSDSSGVAVWFDRTTPLPRPWEHRRRFRKAHGRHREAFALADALAAYHQPRLPHHHLAMLAVTPALRGTGRGSLLLDAHHRTLDAAGLPAYVDVDTGTAAAWLARRGYLTRPTYTVQTGLTRHPLLRHPSAGAASAAA
ncbi:N-acetyltransferase [Actinoplanes sp. NPDC051859]|uniref:N-acetyltransferase n=1 Tax=Actinoplanes sp. NPDC051859 TaxID=3363909 RepID=UPI0037BB34D0